MRSASVTKTKSRGFLSTIRRSLVVQATRCVEAHRPRGSAVCCGAALVSAESTVSIKLVGATEGVMAAKIEASVPQTEGEAGYGRETLPLECPRERERRPA